MHNKEITLLVGYKDGIKACEIDITDLIDKEVAQVILDLEGMRRTWGYEYTSKQQMKERRESHVN